MLSIRRWVLMRRDASLAKSSTSVQTDLNETCYCLTLDRTLLRSALQRSHDSAAVFDALLAMPSGLFSDLPVFLPRASISEMQAAVDAIHEVANLPSYCAEVLSRAPAVAQSDFGPKGAFMGFDFHIAADGPKIIEVNTNAGGAFLNAAIGDAQRTCCNATRPDLKLSPSRFEERVLAMFRAEWRAQRPAGELQRVAIVDERPREQFLYAEFLLARDMFQRNGIDAVITDPADMEIERDRLLWKGQAIDLVYNRLVDFSLERPASSVLREAYMRGLAVFTPNPRVHALFADKRNLVLLSDECALERLGVPPEQRMILARAIPKTVSVDSENAEALWRDRRNYFFKPAAGYGSKAVYRGEKMTRSVWMDILAGGYVAQEYVPPSTRRVLLDGQPADRKVDIRLYTYGREILAIAARLYQGQATNMRTAGGGFAPVFLLDEDHRDGGGERDCCGKDASLSRLG